MNAEDKKEEAAGAETKVRKASPLKVESTTPQRKAAAPKYKVVSEG